MTWDGSLYPVYLVSLTLKLGLSRALQLHSVTSKPFLFVGLFVSGISAQKQTKCNNVFSTLESPLFKLRISFEMIIFQGWDGTQHYAPLYAVEGGQWSEPLLSFMPPASVWDLFFFLSNTKTHLKLSIPYLPPLIYTNRVKFNLVYLV